MSDHFRGVEQEMSNAFRNQEANLENGNGEIQTQSYSSSSSAERGQDGKIHKKVQKSGSQIECHNGVCK